MVDNYLPRDKAEILKVRVGNGQSAIDITWNDEDLCWDVSSRSFGDFWFTVTATGKEGYKEAMKLADAFESLLQRMVRHQADAKADEEAVRVFVDHNRRSQDAVIERTP